MSAPYQIGPWHVDPDPRVDGADQVCRINGNTVAFIATGMEDEEHHLISHLIAAAPDMYVALKAIMRQFDAGYFVRNTEGDGSPDWALKAVRPMQALASAKAAIEKAEKGGLL